MVKFNCNRVDGGSINRNHSVQFTFNNKQYKGYKGDTVASALLASGVKIVGRSFKYGRPRGVFSAGVEEPNAMLQIGASESDQVPNVKATEQLIYEGLVCRSTNGWPSVNIDIMQYVGALIGKVMPPGFYYKTFMFPSFLWRWYERVIRQGAGIGSAPKAADNDQYDKMNHHADVLVVGAGVAGLSAALLAAKQGLSVIIADEQHEFGGQLISNPSSWLVSVLEQLLTIDNLVILNQTTVYAAFDQNFYTASQKLTDNQASKVGVRQRMHRIRAKYAILATGAIERPIVFNNNDRPGCMQANAVSQYIQRYAVVPGCSLVVMTSNDSGYQCAIEWHQNNRQVAAIVDTRAQASQGDLPKQARQLGINILTNSAVIDTKGFSSVKGAIIASIESINGGVVSVVEGSEQTIQCDTVATSGGWNPVVHLSCHTGLKPVWNADIQSFVPHQEGYNALNKNQYTVGAAAGEYDNAKIIQQVKSTIEQITGKVADDIAELASPMMDASDYIYAVNHVQQYASKQFVDFQLDVTVDGIKLATREGFESIEHVKRYTALGFGTDQGKTSNINGLAIVANILDKPIESVGTTVFRPNYTPVSMGLVAGRKCGELFEPKRYTVIQPWHEARGAVYEDVGQWKRPRYFPQMIDDKLETMQQAVERECLAVRNSVGVLDASTLGKIDIQGPDAREFLNRVYTNAWSKLAIGSCRYGLMCGEDGLVKDDGVTVCLGENHFMMHTTTGGAASILEWLELWHQTEWPELNVYFNSVTDHWCTVAVAGPNARALVKELTDADLDPESFKFMQWKQAVVAGIPARIYRISFTGETSFEINVSANYGLTLWNKVIEAGEKYDITPYGTETMHVLRAEKGFPIIGQDTDGSISANNMGMGPMIKMDKPFSFIGKRGMNMPEHQKTNAKHFVGLRPLNTKQVMAEGAQLVLNPQQKIPMTILGHVTSSYYSATLGYSIALAMVKAGHQMMGEIIYAAHVDGTMVAAEICSPVFYDKEGERQRG